MNKLIDMHFHLDFYPNHKQIYNDINRCCQHTLCVTNQPEIFESCIDLYTPTKYVQFALGYNPQNINEVPFNRNVFLRNIQKTKYIGEVGLDFSEKYKNKKKEQEEIFNYILKCSLDKIISVHCKKAEESLYNILVRNNNKKVILHWYNGDEYWLNKFIQLGTFFSVNANMINSNKGSKLINMIPINKLLIESDGPFTSIDGKKYNYDKLEKLYTILADYLKLEFEALSKQISKNYIRLVQNE